MNMQSTYYGWDQVNVVMVTVAAEKLNTVLSRLPLIKKYWVFRYFVWEMIEHNFNYSKYPKLTCKGDRLRANTECMIDAAWPVTQSCILCSWRNQSSWDGRFRHLSLCALGPFEAFSRAFSMSSDFLFLFLFLSLFFFFFHSPNLNTPNTKLRNSVCFIYNLLKIYRI